MILLSLGVFLGAAFATFYFWLKLSDQVPQSQFRQLILAVALTCLFFVICFALGVWFSVARLKGEGWILSA